MRQHKYKSEVVAERPDPEYWLQEFGDYLFSYANRRLRDTAHAEDAVQETLLSALESRDNYAGQASEKTWLTSILKLKIIDFIRKQVREPTTDDIIALSDTIKDNWVDELFDSRGNWICRPKDWGNPYKTLNNHQFIDAVENCLGRLKPASARVFHMKELSEYSNVEICNELGITTTNLSVLLYRARMRLRCCLELKWPDVEKEETI